jgi:hypothetical protein
MDQVNWLDLQQVAQLTGLTFVVPLGLISAVKGTGLVEAGTSWAGRPASSARPLFQGKINRAPSRRPGLRQWGNNLCRSARANFAGTHFWIINRVFLYWTTSRVQRTIFL